MISKEELIEMLEMMNNHFTKQYTDTKDAKDQVLHFMWFGKHNTTLLLLNELKHDGLKSLHNNWKTILNKEE